MRPVCVAALAFAASGAMCPPVSAFDLPSVDIAYTIEVKLDPETRILDGEQTISWRNPSSTAIDTIPLHLYLNGFAHEETTWMRGAPRSFVNLDAILEDHEDPWGWIEPESIQQNSVDLVWNPIAPDDGNNLDRSLIEVKLTEPLVPGATATLQIAFEARLPVPIARTGGRDDFFLVAQWFPKVAVFETAGVRAATEDRWNAHQFHGPTEFYADYADYEVRIGVPAGWNVVATGSGGPVDSSEIEEYVWHAYRQNAVHDFAWCASSRMVDEVSTHQPAGEGPPVELHVFVPDGMQHQAARWRRIAETGLDVLGSRIGPYPYETLTIITPPHWASATFGMEYPTLVTADSGDPLWDSGLLAGVRMNEMAIAHEIAHQYFYGVVGSNEFEEAYLDEGLSEYWGNQIALAEFDGNLATLFGRGLDLASYEIMGLRTEPFPRPVWAGPSYLSRHSGSFSQYYKVPAVTFATAAAQFGQEAVDAVFAGYYRRWSFRHPGFEDFLQAARDFGSDALADMMLEAFTQHQLPDYRVKYIRTKKWGRPEGHYYVDGQLVDPDASETEVGELTGLDPSALEQDGRILMQVHDPGWTQGARRSAGNLERRAVVAEAGETDSDWEAEDETFYGSTARVEGTGWEHLPVEIVFKFADGAVVRDTWDGRSGYRLYQFLRAAPLSEVAVDPGRRIVLDPDRKNNALRKDPDKARAAEWALWLGALFQLLLEGAGQWL